MMNTMLSSEQIKMVEQLSAWVNKFTQTTDQTYQLLPEDIFVGYHGDTAAAIVLKAFKDGDVDTCENEEQYNEV